MRAPRRYSKRQAMLALLFMYAGAACGQSLSCNGQLVNEGDTMNEVLQKCGAPVARQTLCIPTMQPSWVESNDGNLHPFWSQQCAPAEDWSFNRGEGSFTSVVRFTNGVVESIRDGNWQR